jgi:hypothetical protein
MIPLNAIKYQKSGEVPEVYIRKDETKNRLYRLDKQYSPISATASLYYLFDTIGIYHCKIYKILTYYINHIGIILSVTD